MIVMIGAIEGRVTRRIFWSLLAPSIAAASYRAGSTDVIAAR